jgi:hypothetical protein
MPTLEISRSILVNQGLTAGVPGFDVITRPAAAEPASADVLGSFKSLVVNDRAFTVDPGLIDTITALKSPLELATFFINAKYAEVGGAGGFLGTTVSAVIATPNGAGFVRTFQHGAIYWHPNTGAHETHGPIRIRWQELGGENGFLGFPTTDVTLGADVRSEGFVVHFQGGSIYWAPLPRRVDLAGAVAVSSAITTTNAAPVNAASNRASDARAVSSALVGGAMSGVQSTLEVNDQMRSTITDAGPVFAASDALAGARTGVTLDVGLIRDLVETGAGAFEVHGAIREKYLALGAEASILGYPRTDETAAPDGVGRFNHFQSGSIYWTPGTSAHEVHGLIRDHWASLGWERNPKLGYPITDEFIPDLRIGHRRPETRKKPILSIPNDVIKLPADAAAAGFPRSVVNTSVTVSSAAIATPAVTRRTIATTQPATGVAGALGKLSEKSIPLELTSAAAVESSPSVTATLDPSLFGVFTTTPASTPANQRSVNRFADFENGVLFWFRGATSASTISPLSSTADGTSLSFTGADVAAAAMMKIGKSAFETVNAQLLAMTFVGTTGYSFDGAQVHNRRHKLQLILQGIETNTISFPLGVQIPQPVAVTATIELQVEVWFDASQRRILLALTEWTLTQASSGSYATAISTALHAKLDPILWTSFELVTLPDTDGGAPIAVLSVKTLPNGVVGVFVEPHHNLLLTGVDLLANAVTPSVVVFSQPN